MEKGDRIEGFYKTDLLILNPPARKFKGVNDNSLVIKLVYGDFSILFCADIEDEAAGRLLSTERQNLPSDVIKAPHHGSSLGEATGDFLESVSAGIAVISSGGDTVSRDILQEFNRLGARVYRTDRDGAVILSNEKDKYRVSVFTTHPQP